MAMSRERKEQEVTDFKNRLEQIETAVIVHNTGLDMPQINTLRSAARAEGVTVKVVKNTLARRALEGTKFEGLSEMFTGPTMVASSKILLPRQRLFTTLPRTMKSWLLSAGLWGLRFSIRPVSNSLRKCRPLMKCGAHWLAFCRHRLRKLPACCRHRPDNWPALPALMPLKAEVFRELV